MCFSPALQEMVQETFECLDFKKFYLFSKQLFVYTYRFLEQRDAWLFEELSNCKRTFF